MTVSVVRGPVRSEPGEGLSLWRRVLRAGITFLVLPVLALSIAFTLVKIVAQSDQWDLPGGRLLDTILSSCQFEHSSSAGVDVEHMICPTRLGARRVSASSQECGGRQRGRALLFARRDRFPVHGARRVALLSRRPAGRQHDHAAARPLRNAEEGRQLRAQAGRGGSRHQDLCACCRGPKFSPAT